ncbi:hypothetical protein [Azospirillum sp. sgz301742]
MGSLVVLGFLVACSLVALIFRIGVKRVFGYGALADLAGMALLTALFHGTYAGMVVAIIAGLFFSGFIYALRRQLGYERYEFRTRKWVAVSPDPIALPTPGSITTKIGLYAMVFVCLLVVLFMATAALTGAAALVLAPFVGAGAAVLTPFIVRRLS